MGRRVALKISGPAVIHDGVPRAKGRARAHGRIIRQPDGQQSVAISLNTPKETRAAEKAILQAFRQAHPDHRPFTGPVLLKFTAVFETPTSFSKALKEAAARGTLLATRKPDKDNIEKLIVDALNGVAFMDDAQVMGGGIKRYGSPARIEFSLESMDEEGAPKTPAVKSAEKRLRDASAPRPKKRPERNRTKSETDAEVLSASPRREPDLSSWPPHLRDQIRAKLAQEERERAERRRR